MKKISDQEWRTKLTPEQYHIVREKGTEPPGTGIYLENKDQGMYRCIACGQNLFSSNTKFDSGTGWPSFTDSVKDKVDLQPDASDGMLRTEVICKNCGSHLGHVFPDGPGPTGQRYCINSIALDFKQQGEKNE